MASVILQLKSLISLVSGGAGRRAVVMESCGVVMENGHIPTEPLRELPGSISGHEAKDSAGTRRCPQQLRHSPKVSVSPHPLARLSPGPSGNADSVCIPLLPWLTAISCLSDLSLLLCG